MYPEVNAKFWTEGYLIGIQDFANAILHEALEEIQQLPFSPMFDEVYELERGHNRQQAREIKQQGKNNKESYFQY